MRTLHPLAGVYAAAVTPLKPDFTPDLEAIPALLDFLARRGCHGALLLGTTGEGPSFAFADRLAIWRAALAVRQAQPHFHLLAGTGTPSLEETVQLTRAAFDLGLDGVVVLPPYYYKRATDEGLFNWFSRLISQAVPAGGALLGYHIPAVAGVGLSLELVARLRDAHPNRFAGLKDSSSDPELARLLGARFGRDLMILCGNDSLLSLALQAGASGCITALANLASPDLRLVWDSYLSSEAFQHGEPNPRWKEHAQRSPQAGLDSRRFTLLDQAAQARLSALRAVLDRYPPAPALLKGLLARCYGFARWPVALPLQPLSAESEIKAAAEMGLMA